MVSRLYGFRSADTSDLSLTLRGVLLHVRLPARVLRKMPRNCSMEIGQPT